MSISLGPPSIRPWGASSVAAAAAPRSRVGRDASPTAGPVAGPVTNTVDMTPAWLAAQGSAPYVLGGSNTTYVLETNVSTPGTAFVLGGSGNTLNLNGYTVTYDNAAPVVFTNNLFQQGSGSNVPGWIVTGTNATLVPNTFYLAPL